MRHRLCHLLPDVPGVRRALRATLPGRIARWHLCFPISCELPFDMFKAGLVLRRKLMHEAQHRLLVPVFP